MWFSIAHRHVGMNFVKLQCNHEGIAYRVGLYFGDFKSVDQLKVKQIKEYLWSPAQVKQKCKESLTADEALDLLLVQGKEE